VAEEAYRRLWLTSIAILCFSTPYRIHKRIAALIMKLIVHGLMLAGLSIIAAASSLSQPKQAVFGIDNAIDRYLIELAPGETRWIREDEKWALRRVCANPSPFPWDRSSVSSWPVSELFALNP